MLRNNTTNIILRIGLGFAFLYPAIDALLDPYSWLGYFPKFMHGIVPDMLLLHGFGLIEVIIALWILSGKHVLIPSAAATLILISIIILDFRDFQIVFRDVSIATIAFALAVDAYRNKKTPFI